MSAGEHSMVLQGVRSTDRTFVNRDSGQECAMVIRALVDWHRDDEREVAGLEFSIETPVWNYAFVISRGGLLTLVDMQEQAQREIDEQITRERNRS